MKKFIALLLTVVICFTSFAAFAAGDNIKVYLDGKQLTFDVEPQLIRDRVMVPVRAIFEGLGANVQWNEENQKVVSSKENIIVTLTIGSYIMQVVDVSKGTEKEVMLDVTPVEINGRTLIPARFVAEAFGCDVQWDDSTQSVFISTDPSNPHSISLSSSSSESFSSPFDTVVEGIKRKGTYDNESNRYTCTISDNPNMLLLIYDVGSECIFFNYMTATEKAFASMILGFDSTLATALFILTTPGASDFELHFAAMPFDTKWTVMRADSAYYSPKINSSTHEAMNIFLDLCEQALNKEFGVSLRDMGIYIKF